MLRFLCELRSLSQTCQKQHKNTKYEGLACCVNLWVFFLLPVNVVILFGPVFLSSDVSDCTVNKGDKGCVCRGGLHFLPSPLQQPTHTELTLKFIVVSSWDYDIIPFTNSSKPTPNPHMSS